MEIPEKTDACQGKRRAGISSGGRKETATVPGPIILLFMLIVISIVLVEILIIRPEITATGGGKVLALVVLLVLWSRN